VLFFFFFGFVVGGLGCGLVGGGVFGVLGWGGGGGGEGGLKRNITKRCGV